VTAVTARCTASSSMRLDGRRGQPPLGAEVKHHDCPHARISIHREAIRAHDDFDLRISPAEGHAGVVGKDQSSDDWPSRKTCLESPEHESDARVRARRNRRLPMHRGRSTSDLQRNRDPIR
jgi:hypothetical protein